MFIYEEIFRDFQKHKVKYIVVGGVADNLLGSYRGTADLDILAELTDDNLAKVVTILKKGVSGQAACRSYGYRKQKDPS